MVKLTRQLTNAHSPAAAGSCTSKGKLTRQLTNAHSPATTSSRTSKTKLMRQLTNTRSPATTGSRTSKGKLMRQLFPLTFRLKSASIEPETRLLMWVIGLLRGITKEATE